MASTIQHPPSSILSAAKLGADLKALERDPHKGDETALRNRTRDIIRRYYVSGKETVRTRFDEDGDAKAVVINTSRLVDGLLAQLFAFACEHSVHGEPSMTLVAVGGYGRVELFPYSDVDLLFLFDEKDRKPAAKVSEFILYILWDIGFTIGHAVRNIEETLEEAEKDITIRTTLLDARLLAGEHELFDRFHQRFFDELVDHSALEFVEGKLAERDQRHKRVGDSRYVLEPNVKEGKGGLRDLHTIYWLAKYNYNFDTLQELVKRKIFTPAEYKSFVTDQQFLWAVRVRLHYLAGRGEERLTFDRQREIGQMLGYRDRGNVRSVERFMKRYFQVAKDVGNLTRIFCATLEEEKKRKPRLLMTSPLRKKALGPFVIEGERLGVADEAQFLRDPMHLVALFHTAQAQQVDIHPRTLQLVSRNLGLINREALKDERINALFLEILLSPLAPDVTLRRMNEAGVLGKLVPDFGRVIGQMQYDMYHVYTVDEHTIFAIGILHAIENGTVKEELPLASQIIHHITMRRVLYLALFCHDIAKGRGGDHSMLGEKVVAKLATRLGFDALERETAAWLVRYHLLFSNTAFKRDINDPQTVQDFVAKVQTLERLRLLLILTAADIRAVGPQVWNGWKGALLRNLYYRAEALMGAGDNENAASQQRDTLRDALSGKLAGWSVQDVDAYLELGNPVFWSGIEADTHAQIARMMKEVALMGLPLKIETRHDHFRSNTELALCTPDQHGLFSKVTGVLSLSGANIVDCKIFTLKNGLAVELFRIQDFEGKPYDKPDKLAKLTVLAEMAISGRLDIDLELSRQRPSYASRMEAFKVPHHVFIDNDVSANHTVIEISGRDRIGFLYTITKALSDLRLTIATAHISTYGERAVDVFYVKDIFGMKITHERRLREIHDALMEALASHASQAPKQVAG